MCDGVTRYRLSILAFDDLAGLDHAIEDLIGNGVVPAQLCLAGLAKSLETLHVPKNLDHQAKSEFASLLASPDLPLQLDGLVEIVARSGAWTAALIRQPGAAMGTFDWMQEERRKELARHAANGAVILLVSAASAAQLAASAGVLLRHGRHNLQTHVFAWPNAR